MNPLERRYLHAEIFVMLACAALIIWFLGGVPSYLAGMVVLEWCAFEVVTDLYLAPRIYQRLREERAAAVVAFMEENARLLDAAVEEAHARKVRADVEEAVRQRELRNPGIVIPLPTRIFRTVSRTSWLKPEEK